VDLVLGGEKFCREAFFKVSGQSTNERTISMKELPELPYYSESGKLVEYHHDGDAGLDLPIWDEGLNNGEKGFHGKVSLDTNESVTLKTGVYVAIPEGHFGFLDSRSGTSKKKLDLLCRIIDQPYRGNIRLAIINLNPDEYVTIENGDELFQIVIIPYTKVKTMGFDSLEEFLAYAGNTERGADGFGSKERNKGETE